MDTIKEIETTVASWYKNAPHLPKNGQKWLAENAWGLTLIGVILETFFILIVFSVTFLVSGLLLGGSSVIGAALGGLAFTILLVTTVFSVVNIVIALQAITPLRLLQKKGWTLLFVLLLLNVCAQALSFLFGFNILQLIWGALWLAVLGYFLFEIRDFYTTEKVPSTKAKSKPTVKKV